MLKFVIGMSMLLLVAPRADLIDDLLRLSPKTPAFSAPPAISNTAPSDDAPLEELGRFWSDQAESGDARKLSVSDKTRARLLEAVIAEPELAPALLPLLPRTTVAHDRIKQLYDDYRRRFGRIWGEELRTALMRNTAHFRDDLIREAGAASDADGYVEHEEDIEALVELDWARAEPLLKKSAEAPMPRRAALAKALLYGHYPSGTDAERLNRELRQIVEDRSAVGYSRSEALKALLTRDWPGRDEWYRGLFQDPSLRMLRDGGSSSPLCQRVWSEPDRWIPVLARLVGNADREVHDNAVQCLSEFGWGDPKGARRDALEPLLPWLLDPNWSSAWQGIQPSGRLGLIQNAPKLDLHESIPGLIAVLNQDVAIFERRYAAESLAKFGDPRAIPALRQALASVPAPARVGFGSFNYRQVFILALVELGGVPDTEAVSAVEAYATMLGNRDPGSLEVSSIGLSGPALPDPVLLGQRLARGTPPSENVVALLLARVAELQTQDRQAADRLLAIMDRWPSALADRDLARRIVAGTAPAASIRAAILRRETFAANASETLRASLSSSGVSSGIFAALAADPRREQEILNGSDIEAKRALLAGARIAADPLPLDAVERIYNSGDGVAERAAMAYLTANDSPRAREILTARLKGTVIVGARGWGEDPAETSESSFARQEAALLAMMKGDNAADEVFALLSSAYRGGEGQIVIQRHGNRATLTSQNGTGDNRRTLSAAEFTGLRAFVDSEKVDDLGPLMQFTLAGAQYDYVHLTRNSARRVFMGNPNCGKSGGSVYDRLCSEFLRLVR